MHYLLFSFKQLYLQIPGISEALHCGPWLLDNSSDNSFHSSVRNLARNTWSWPVYGEMMFFPLPAYGPNSAHWNIQKFSCVCNQCHQYVLQKEGYEGLERALCFYPS